MRQQASALLIAVGLMLAAVQPASAIVYGDPDTDDVYPNVGSMLVVDGSDLYQWCSGTLIRDGRDDGSNHGVFLTAAHCTAAVEAYGYTFADVRITYDQDGSSDRIPVTGAYQHPQYSQRQADPHDIAVLYFDVKTGLTPAQVAPLGYLGRLGKQSIRKEVFATVGYGVVREHKQKGLQGIDWDNMARRYATQHMQSIEKAWLTLAMNDRATENGGTCYGDSGGPHFHGSGANRVIVSITVTGDAVCKAADKTYRLDTRSAQAFLEDALADPD